MKKNIKHTLAILAFNNHKLTKRNLYNLIHLGYKKNILLFDNGSIPSFKNFAKKIGVRYQRETDNIYVNPAWNKIISQENCDYLTLLNNDCFIESSKYFEDIIFHMKKNNIIISSCKTKNILRYNFFVKFLYKLKYIRMKNTSLKYSSIGRRQGWLMTINLNIYKKLDFQIPEYIKVWYGDDWIWSQIIINNLKYAIYTNRYVLHVRGTSTSKIPHLIQDDINNINKYGDWFKEITEQMHSKKYV